MSVYSSHSYSLFQNERSQKLHIAETYTVACVICSFSGRKVRNPGRMGRLKLRIDDDSPALCHTTIANMLEQHYHMVNRYEDIVVDERQT